MRILFVNHTSGWSGAEVSLMRVVEELRGRHEVAVACPSAGPLADAVDRAAIRRLRIPAVEVSLRLHPTQTPVGVGQLATGGAAFAWAARRFRPDVVHANTLRAGLMGAIAGRLGAPPIVVRTHDRLPLTLMGHTVRSVIAGSASAVVAVSDFTARNFNEGLPRPVATRVYNSVDHAGLDPGRTQPAGLRTELGLGPEALLLGQVAQITPWKGQHTAIRALAQLRRGGLDAHLVLVGAIAFTGPAVRYDNRGYLRSLEELSDELAVRDAVHFVGQRPDVPEILRDLDLSLLPSLDEPFGLVTVESMALGTPPLVSAAGAGPELVTDGVTGRVLAPDRPDAWAAAARDLLLDRRARIHMGDQARVAAARFTDDRHAQGMMKIYERVVSRPAPGPLAEVVNIPQRSEELVEAAR